VEHFYKNINSENWFNYEDLYSSIVSRFPTDSHFVEVGVWKGMSACFMAVEIINSNKNIKFDCVDTWEYVPTSKELEEDKFENLYDVFLNNIEPVKDKINIVKGISWEAASNYADNSLDFVFIDAGHDYESVKKDLTAWFPKIKPNGIIAGHDYHFDCGVYPAVNEFFGKEKMPSMKSCWIYEKSE
jgi:predicted O-methyltransferase YrrM